MLETIKKHWQARVALLIFLFFFFWWLWLQSLPNDSQPHLLFGETYGIMAVWGGIVGLAIAKKWGGWHSVMGKAAIMFSLGLFAQEFGQLAYAYYTNYLHIDIPYPSVGDLGFFGTIPFYIAGSLMLAKASGVKVSLRSFASKLQAVVIPALLLGLAYFLFLKEYEIDLSSPLKVFLDLGYPLGQAVYISIGILTYSLTRNMLGGVMKNKIRFFIFAFGAQFLSDYIFLYFQDQYYAGSFIDLIYLLAYFLMTMALLQLRTVFTKLSHEEGKK